MRKDFLKFLPIITLISSVFVACNSKTLQENKADSTLIVKTDSVVSTQASTDTMLLEDVLACVTLKGLQAKYGANNIKKEAIIETGEGQFKATKLFFDTENEIEVYWKDGKEYQYIQEVMVRARYTKDEKMDFSSPWKSKAGIHLGMKLSDIIALNGKTFTMSGIGWDLGGNVISWEGGKLANANTILRFNDFSDNSGGLTEKEYSEISGDREIDVAHASIQKLNPTIDQLSIYITPDIDAELGHKMVKQVEANQIKK